MNNIKFIEELIKNIETNITITKIELEKYTDLGDDEEVDRTKNNLEYLKEHLKHLNEIKTELEMWYVIKPNIRFEVHYRLDGIPKDHPLYSIIEKNLLKNNIRNTTKDSKFPYKIKSNEILELDVIHTLGRLEDLMEEYEINSIEELENIIIAFRELVDKNRNRDIPKKPLIKEYKNSEHYLCPNCQGHKFGILDYGEYKNEWRKGSELMPYCPRCGQKLDWSDE